MSPVLIVYLITVAVALTLMAAVAWSEPPEGDQGLGLVLAVLFCGLGPIVILASLGYVLSHWEPRHVRDAKKAVEVAELQAREAAAIAARERDLGLR